MSFHKELIQLFLCTFVLGTLVTAQNAHGSLRGAIQDTTGARIPDATIVVQSTDESTRREAKSEDRGEFRVDDLQPGHYRIRVTAKGFREARADVSVALSSVREITVTLKAVGPSETVSVQSNTSSITTQPIDLASAVHEGIISSRDLESLPLASRSFANIAYLAPGTEPVEPSDPTKARITAVSTGGSSGLNNDLSVDGGDNSDDWIGGFLQNFSPDAIQEFAMRTANEDADTGGTTAGSVVITTKRGSNDWHGTGAFYERAAALNARFPIENPAGTCDANGCVNNPKQPFSRQNYVAALGGPLKRDKFWFFSSLEYVHEDASIAYSPASSTQFDALSQLAANGLIPGVSSIDVPNTVSIPFRDFLGSLRFDWAQSTKSQWFVRASEDTYLTHNNLVQQATLPSTGLTTHNNYWNGVLSNTFAFSPNWLGTFVFDASTLHLTQARNSTLGFALAFPFSATSLTVSGFETYGDNQFATPITLFPSLRNQEKYQFRYDLGHATGDHSLKFGVNFIHEPVLSGAFPGNQETLHSFPEDPTFYLTNPGQFASDYAAGASTTPAGDGSFSQNVQRLGMYAEDSWRATRHLTVNYGLRWQTTWGLFTGSGHSQEMNPAFVTLKALQIPFATSVPHDYRKQFGPRLGIAYSPGGSGNTVIRAGFGLFYNDLAQNGWATAFEGVNNTNASTGNCTLTGGSGSYSLAGPGCLQGGAGATGNLIDAAYKTPYGIHATGGAQHAFNRKWTVSADFTHEEGNHGYRGYSFTSGANLFTPLIPTSDPNHAADQQSVVPNLNLFKSDNRSSYNALMIVAQGNVSQRFNLIAHYTLSRANTWGCVLGELWDYVNGVCDPLSPFGPGDYGPSGEDVTHRFVLAGTLHLPGGLELSTLTQAESARPITLTTPVGDRAVINGVKTSLDQFRGTPFIQADVRVSRPFQLGDRVEVRPFAEFFNLFNRNNPGANYVTDISALPNPVNDLSNATAICGNPNCSTMVPITNPQKQLLFPAGALGDFFGPGTTVGIPFAAQLGVRVNF
ncbi:MAG TPA: carboxypeptidase regulatory-like domain-containing protein [Candidatus Sulfotelmatobacter sp.]|nr:carboxypeptidase regulatory-like domain-containing protein [Candidatus Sulfotelmatobacter sp.]